METELQYLNDEGLKYLIEKNEKAIEVLKANNEAMQDELNRRETNEKKIQ